MQRYSFPIQESGYPARDEAQATYGRDYSYGTNERDAAPAVNMSNKSSWTALLRAVKKNLSTHCGIGAAAIGTGAAHGGIQLADSVLPRIPVELWPSDAFESCPDLMRLAGLPEVADFHSLTLKQFSNLERPIVQRLLALKPVGLRGDFEVEADDGSKGGGAGAGVGGGAEDEEAGGRPARADPTSPAEASPGRATLWTVPRLTRPEPRQPSSRNDPDGSSSKIVADQLRIASTAAHAQALVEELHESFPLTMAAVFGPTAPARRIEVAAIPNLVLHMKHQQQVREAWRASALQAGSPLAQALSDPVCDRTFAKLVKNNASMQPGESGHEYSLLEQLYGILAVGHLATAVASTYFTPGAEGASAGLNSAITNLSFVNGEGDLNDLSESVGRLAQAVGEALAEGVDVDNTRACKAIHAALAEASTCTFTATIPGAKKLDWGAMVDETLAAAAARGSGKYDAEDLSERLDLLDDYARRQYQKRATKQQVLAAAHVSAGGEAVGDSAVYRAVGAGGHYKQQLCVVPGCTSGEVKRNWALCKLGHVQPNIALCGSCKMLTPTTLPFCTFALSGGCPGLPAGFTTPTQAQVDKLTACIAKAHEKAPGSNGGGRAGVMVSAASPGGAGVASPLDIPVDSVPRLGDVLRGLGILPHA